MSERILSEETWEGLDDLKEVDESFDDVVSKLMCYWWINQTESEMK